MKKIVLASLMMVCLPYLAMAQSVDDDLYFIPKKKAEKKVQRVENKLHKAENNTIQIVKNLLKQNLDINLISKVTGMSVNKIKSLNV